MADSGNLLDRSGGVYTYNKYDRTEMLKKNLGKYHMYLQTFSHPVGLPVNISTRELKHITGKMSLFDYTHISQKSPIKDSVMALILNSRPISAYTMKPTNKSNIFDKYEYLSSEYGKNYATFVDSVYGITSPSISWQNENGLIKEESLNFTRYIDSIAVITNIDNAINAMKGEITTNPNINGEIVTDTKLGRLSNQIYSNRLYLSSILNSERKFNNLTPSLSKIYGNNSENFGKLSTLFTIPKGGRITELDKGSNEVRIQHFGQEVETHDTYDATMLSLVEDVVSISDNFKSLYEKVIKDNVASNYLKDYFVKDDNYGKAFYYHPLYPYAKIYTLKEDNTTILKYGAGIAENVTTKLVRNTTGKEDNYIRNTWNERDIKSTIVEETLLNKGAIKTNIGGSVDVDDLTGDIWSDRAIGENSLLYKTKKMFATHKIETMVGRFHNSDTSGSTIDTAIGKEGRSKGRNLLKKDCNRTTNHYDNPYCRVWTFHHQYDRLSRLIRPFENNNSWGTEYSCEQNHNIGFAARFKSLSSTDTQPVNGIKYLTSNTVLQDNGFVRITPKDTNKTKRRDEIKKCMFSIENLAWKDVPKYGFNYLSEEQKGPNGGRIMWFPPYDLNFSENVSTSWEQNDFIGRGESIYTYKNTVRSGTLKFSLLIDHPSIINTVNDKIVDYGGESKKESISVYGDVTHDDILRYFAGCQPLVPNRNAFDINSADYVHNGTDTGDKPVQPESQTIDSTQDIKIVIPLFFPNDYSGHMGAYSQLNGNNVLVDNGNTSNFYPDENSKIETIENVENCTSYDSDFIDYIVSGKCCRNNGGNGYEIKIGFDKKNANSFDYLNDNGGISYPSNGSHLKVTYKDRNNRRNKLFNANINEDGYPIYYRNDVDLRQLLENKKDTYDAVSYGLNSNRWMLQNVNIEHVVGYGTVDNATGYVNPVNTASPNDKKSGIIIISFTDLLHCCGYSGVDDKTGNESVEINKNRVVTSNIFVTNKDNVKEPILKLDNAEDDICITTSVKDLISSIKNPINGNIVKDITIYGSASNNDINENRATLADRRAKIFKKILIDKLGFDSYSTKIKTTVSMVNSPEKSNNNYSYDNSFRAKLGRCSTCIITLNGARNTSTVGNTGNEENTNTNEAALNNIANGIIMQVENETDAIEGAKTNFYEASEVRYDDEYRFFKKIEEDDGFYHRNLKEKFKFFTPAFHSITPEGFNARLTFLQQCTRQGHTISASDPNMGQTASNLSFGRMPVCVIRIGDFINTRAIIEGVSIDYNSGKGMTWDLNPEGAGVQPMFANISLSVKLIGGQSLQAPITRLQNAISFNYYANAGVYDNRSDRAHLEFGHKIANGNTIYSQNETDITTVYDNVFTPLNYVLTGGKNEYYRTLNGYNTSGNTYQKKRRMARI